MIPQDATFPMVAKTFQGLEDVLRDELITLGAENVEIGNRMVSFNGNLEIMYKANLCLRSALSVLVPIEKFSASDPDELYEAVRDIEWDRYMTPDTTFAIDSTVNSREFTHSKFVTYRVKDGIVDYFNEKYGRRPSIRLDGAEMEFNVHISDNRITISLNSSGETLNKRGYRVSGVSAPINEVLAAGIILKTGWRGDSPFVDPMCGSGTFLIEAALIAANINPGIFRDRFAFENWKNFDKDLFEQIYNDDSAERTPGYKIYGGDINPDAVTAARKNIRQARLEEYITLECKSFAQWNEAPDEIPGILITNPPYGERIKPDDIDSLYREIGSQLKHHFQGYHAWILGYEDKHFANIGLRPSVKFPILNGPLECSLREYVLFDGSYSNFRSEGGSVKNEEFNREYKHKAKRMSDSEWESESKRYSEKKRRNPGKEQDRRKEKKILGKHDRKDRKEADKTRGYKRDRNNTERPFKPAREINGKGPRISEKNSIVFSKSAMRSRRTWKKSRDNGSED